MVPVIYGKTEKKVVALVSGWEPLLSLHSSLIQKAYKYCVDNDMELLLVMFDPHLSEFVGQTIAPKFHSTEACISLLKKQFCGAICKLVTNSNDLELGAADLLLIIEQHSTVAELWLLEGYFLGSRFFNAASQLCNIKGIRLNILSTENDLSELTLLVRKYLSEGEIRAATEIVGHAPIWTRQSDISIPIGWKPGKYKYYPLLLIADKFTLNGRYNEMEIFMEPEGYSAFKWPDDSLDLIAITS